MKDARVTIQKVTACSEHCDPKDCLSCCYRNGGYSDIDCRHEGKINFKIIVEILNPQPESAKFFRLHHYGTEFRSTANPKFIVLDGDINRTSLIFDTEKDGREWANDILLAVIRKSWGGITGDMEIKGTSIDIKFYHSPHDHYSPSLLREEKEVDKDELIICVKPDCPREYSSECSIECLNEQKSKEKPDCFGRYGIACEGSDICSSASLCKDHPSKEEIYPECFGTYSSFWSNCGDCGRFSYECLKRTEQIRKERVGKPFCFGRYGINGKPCKYIKSCSFTPSCISITSYNRVKKMEKPNCFSNYPQYKECVCYDFRKSCIRESEKPNCFGHSDKAVMCLGSSDCFFYSLCKNAPSCFGDYPQHKEIACCDCSKVYFNMCLIKREKTQKEKEETSEIPTPDPNPQCFGEYVECAKHFLFKNGNNSCHVIPLCKLESNLKNKYRIMNYSANEEHVIYSTTFEDCVKYILDNSLQSRFYTIEVRSDNDWIEWRSSEGKKIGDMGR